AVPMGPPYQLPSERNIYASRHHSVHDLVIRRVFINWNRERVRNSAAGLHANQEPLPSFGGMGSRIQDSAFTVDDPSPWVGGETDLAAVTGNKFSARREDTVPIVRGIGYPEMSVRSPPGQSRPSQFTGSSAASSECLDVFPRLVEDTYLLRLPVQDVDSAVRVHRQRKSTCVTEHVGTFPIDGTYAEILR